MAGTRRALGPAKPLTLEQPLDDCGDYVVVTNTRAVVVTGRKADQKLYRHHSGFPGGLKEIPYKKMMESKPEEVSSRLCFALGHCC